MVSALRRRRLADTLQQVRIERRTDGTIVSVLDGEPTAPTPQQKRRGYLLDLSQAKDNAFKLELDWDPALTASSASRSRRATICRPAALGRRRAACPPRFQRPACRAPADRPAPRRARLSAPDLAIAGRSTGADRGGADRRQRHRPPAGFVWSDPAAPSRADKDSYEWDFPRPVAIERLRLALPQDNVLAPAGIAARTDQAAHGEWRELARPCCTVADRWQGMAAAGYRALHLAGAGAAPDPEPEQRRPRRRAHALDRPDGRTARLPGPRRRAVHAGGRARYRAGC
ncbi:MAG: DUF3999 family protein [Aliidongia sp.]